MIASVAAIEKTMNLTPIGRFCYLGSMSFAHPELLLMLLPILLLYVYRVRQQRRSALRYPTLRLIRMAQNRRVRIVGWGRPVLQLLGLILLLSALAGPRTADERTPIAVEGIAILLVLDVSHSMGEPLAPGEPLTRLDAAKMSFRQFVAGDGDLQGRPRDAIGVVSFAALPETVCPLTLNHDVVLELVDKLQPQSGIDAGTNIGDALAEGLNRLDAANTRRSVLILLSDGEHNSTGEALKPRQAANLAASLGIPIDTIDCAGAADATPERIEQRREGRKILETIAEQTGGTAFTANNLDELRQAYERINDLEREPTTSFYYQKYHDHTIHCAATALLLWSLLGLLNQTLWRQLP